jgi:hypothetical protein
MAHGTSTCLLCLFLGSLEDGWMGFDRGSHVPLISSGINLSELSFPPIEGHQLPLPAYGSPEGLGLYSGTATPWLLKGVSGSLPWYGNPVSPVHYS